MSCIKKGATLQGSAKKERVPLPEIGPDTYVCITELGARDLFDLEGQKEKIGNNLQYLCEVLSRVLVDDEGQRLYDDGKELYAHLNLPISSLQRLEAEFIRISGFKGEDADPNYLRQRTISLPSATSSDSQIPILSLTS